MGSRNRVFCEINPDTKRVIRIIKAKGGALMLPPERVAELPRKDAVESIRRQVLERANGICDKCARILTWGTLHMHERIARSAGGEQSLSNAWALCYDCHILGEHGNRAPQWKRS